MVHEYYAVYSPSSEDVFNGKGFLPKDVDKNQIAEFTISSKTRDMIMNEMIGINSSVMAVTQLGQRNNAVICYPGVAVAATINVDSEGFHKLYKSFDQYGQRLYNSATFAPEKIGIGTPISARVIIDHDILHSRRVFVDAQNKDVMAEIQKRKKALIELKKVGDRSSRAEAAAFDMNNINNLYALRFALAHNGPVQGAPKNAAEQYAKQFFAEMAHNGTISMIQQIPEMYKTFMQQSAELSKAHPEISEATHMAYSMSKVCEKYQEGANETNRSILRKLEKQATSHLFQSQEEQERKDYTKTRLTKVLPVHVVSEDVLVAMQSIAASTLEDPGAWKRFENDYYNSLNKVPNPTFDDVVQSVSNAAYELICDPKWHAYIQDSGVWSTEALAEQLMDAVLQKYDLTGGVQVHDAEKLDFLSRMTNTLSAMRFADRADYVTRFIDEAEARDDSVLNAAQNAYLSWKQDHSYNVDAAFNEDLADIQRDAEELEWID
jgi:hypothetical protein